MYDISVIYIEKHRNIISEFSFDQYANHLTLILSYTDYTVITAFGVPLSILHMIWIVNSV